MLQRFYRWLRQSRWGVVLAAGGILVLLFLFFLGSVTLLEYTESTEFCSLCHVMAPEYTAYESSPHARAECGSCHIGPGALPAVQAKLASARYLWVYPLGHYERPIPSPITSLRPVEVVCEQCHWPQKFYDDRLVTLAKFAPDEANSLTRIAMVVNTGGGSKEQGLGRGIHWHIDNPVYYIATDAKRQDIPWVQATFGGTTIEYVSTDSNLTPDAIARLEKRKMDCIDCHNRASHNFRRPDDALNQALALGQIPSDLPYIKREGVRVLEKKYATEEEAATAIAGVAEFYKQNYPDLYARRKADVEKAVAGLQAIFDNTQFPFMGVDWRTHTNNIGHRDFPGCFRCHDGKHLSKDNQAVRLECNICHSIPQVANPGQPLPPLEISTANEPASHRSTTWLAEHRYQFDLTCATCHTVDNPGGNDNSSFCSNSVCHGAKWVYAGLDAPRVRELSAPPKMPGTGVPNPIPHPIGQRTDCVVCHGPDKVFPYPTNHASFGPEMCTACHRPLLQETTVPPVPTATATPIVTVAPTPTAVPTAAAVPTTPTPMTTPTLAVTSIPDATTTPAVAGGPLPIPHPLAGRENCVLCHAPDSAIKPAPKDHEGRPNAICQVCHQLAPQTGAEEAATVTPTATVPTPTRGAEEGTAAGPATIPHELTGRENCLLCHDPSSAVKPAPANHVGRTNEMCQLCHKPR